jgi:hypothetical protein
VPPLPLVPVSPVLLNEITNCALLAGNEPAIY